MHLQNPPDTSNQILHPVNRKLFQRWRMLYHNELVPSRNDLDLKVIGSILGHVAIIEAAGMGAGFRFRLAGTELRTIFGMELTNTDFLNLWSQKDRQALCAMLEMAMTDGEAISVRFTIHTGHTGHTGHTATGHSETVEAVFLPMREKGQALAAFAAFAQPYWLGSEPVVRNKLLSIRTVTSRETTGPHKKPLVLVSLQPEDNGRNMWPGFRVIRGGRK